MNNDRGPSRLREPIFVPRWVLLCFYGFLVVLATATVIRGSATLDLTQPESYTPLWSLAVGLGALIAALATIIRPLADLEKWAAAWCAGWLGFLAIQAFFVANGSGWLIVVGFWSVPAMRTVGLFSKRTT
jgi:hypothetical protein